MVKCVFLFKRKEGTTHEHFRNYYESNHAPLVSRLVPFFKSYSRNYIRQGEGFVPKGTTTLGAVIGYDCVTELEFETQADYDKALQRLADPEVRSQIVADENNFMDRTPGGRLMYIVDEHKSPAASLRSSTA
jgi:uncharacterized protein (TIGR02118 family)